MSCPLDRESCHEREKWHKLSEWVGPMRHMGRTLQASQDLPSWRQLVIRELQPPWLATFFGFFCVALDRPLLDTTSENPSPEMAHLRRPVKRDHYKPFGRRKVTIWHWQSRSQSKNPPKIARPPTFARCCQNSDHTLLYMPNSHATALIHHTSFQDEWICHPPPYRPLVIIHDILARHLAYTLQPRSITECQKLNVKIYNINFF